MNGCGLSIASGGSGGDPHSCIAIKGYGSATDVGTVYIFNNTMYNCSSWLNRSKEDASCAIVDFGGQPNVTRTYVNNIIYQPAYTNFSKENVFVCGGITNSQALTLMAGSADNIWYSSAAAASTYPAQTYGTLANPAFNNAPKGDFTLALGSPAIQAGMTPLVPSTDIRGNARPKSAFYRRIRWHDGFVVQPTLTFTYTLTGTAAASQSVTISTAGGALQLDNWSTTNRASWLSESPSSGTSAGVCTAAIDTAGLVAGTVTIASASATTNLINSVQNVGVTLIVYAAPAIANTTLPAALRDRSYATTLLGSGGQQPYGWRVDSGALCSGLTLCASGTIAGFPTTLGGCTFTVKLTEAGGAVATRTFTIVVNTPVRPRSGAMVP